MASSSPSQSISYRYGKQGCPGGCCRCQQGQYGGESFLVPTYRVSPWETASQILSPSSNKQGPSITMPGTGFGVRCMGHHGNSNGPFNFSAGSNRILPPTKPSVVHGDQQRNGNNDFTCLPLHVARDGFPSTFNSLTHSAPDDPLHSEHHGPLGFDDNGSGSQGFQMPVNNPLSVNHAGSYPFIPRDRKCD
jgi:hypothetical protein